MYDQTLATDAGTRLTITTGGGTAIETDLYSPQGLALVASLWL